MRRGSKESRVGRVGPPRGRHSHHYQSHYHNNDGHGRVGERISQWLAMFTHLLEWSCTKKNVPCLSCRGLLNTGRTWH
jgi:hypothetical protein